MKNTKGATVYTIGIFNGAETSYLGKLEDNWDGWMGVAGIDDEDKANRFMHLVSSNSLQATDLGVGWIGESIIGYTGITNNFDCDPPAATIRPLQMRMS